MDLLDVVLLIAFFVGVGLTTFLLHHFQHIHRLSFADYLFCLGGGVLFAGMVLYILNNSGQILGRIAQRRKDKQE